MDANRNPIDPTIVDPAPWAPTEPDREHPGTPRTVPPGQDTATGTDPDAEYAEPGYQDKSLGQAVDQDRALVEQLLRDTDGDLDEAERRFRQSSAGRPTLERQRRHRRNAERQHRIVHHTTDDRFSLRIGPDLVATATCRSEDGRLIVDAIEVEEDQRGRGLGTELAEGILEHAGAVGATVEPRCPFFAAHVEAHPEHAHLIASAAS